MSLSGAKQGDKIVWTRPDGWTRIGSIDRVTAHQAIVIDGRLAFWISSGMDTRGDGKTARFATPEEIEKDEEEQHRLELVANIGRANLYQLPIFVLEKINNLIVSGDAG